MKHLAKVLAGLILIISTQCFAMRLGYEGPDTLDWPGISRTWGDLMNARGLDDNGALDKLLAARPQARIIPGIVGEVMYFKPTTIKPDEGPYQIRYYSFAGGDPNLTLAETITKLDTSASGKEKLLKRKWVIFNKLPLTGPFPTFQYIEKDDEGNIKMQIVISLGYEGDEIITTKGTP